MTKLCARGKAAAKRKFKVYPSAYANAYASKICAGKIKDTSGVKRKDFKGPKPTSAKEGMMTEIEKEAQKRKDIKKTRDMLMKAREEGGRFSQSDIDIATKQAKELRKSGRETGGRQSSTDDSFVKEYKKLKKVYDKKTKTNVFQTKKIISENPSRYTPSNRGVSDALLNKHKTRETGGRLSVSDVEKLMDAMPKYNVGGHSVMGSPVSVDVDGDTLSNPSASAYYKDLLK